MSAPPPPLPPRRLAPPVLSAAPPPLPPRRPGPSVPTAIGSTSLASAPVPSMPTMAGETPPQLPPPPPSLWRRIVARAATTSTTETDAPAPPTICGPPYLVKPLYVSEGKNPKVTILAQAGKKQRVSVEHFNRLNGHDGAASSAGLPPMQEDEDPMVGSSAMASQPPPPPAPAPAPAPAEPRRAYIPPADTWNIPQVIGTPKTETWWVQQAATYRERIAGGDLRKETGSLVKTASMEDLLTEQDGPQRAEPLGFKDGQDRFMELAFDYLEKQCHDDARPGLIAARAAWQAGGGGNGKAREGAGQEEGSKLASLGRRLLKKPSAYFRKQSD
ncbi:hypothetical protein MMC18_004963 [Xylographa bjoerkii]|nr:hypothetical protein [Xylographa bjoerkii]